MITITGHGMVRTDGKDVGRVEYRIAVTTGPGLKSADGTFTSDAGQLIDAFDAGSTTLVREDSGYEMKIVITELNVDGSGSFAVSGSPGSLD